MSWGIFFYISVLIANILGFDKVCGFREIKVVFCSVLFILVFFGCGTLLLGVEEAVVE